MRTLQQESYKCIKEEIFNISSNERCAFTRENCHKYKFVNFYDIYFCQFGESIPLIIMVIVSLFLFLIFLDCGAFYPNKATRLHFRDLHLFSRVQICTILKTEPGDGRSYAPGLLQRRN